MVNMERPVSQVNEETEETVHPDVREVMEIAVCQEYLVIEDGLVTRVR